MIIGISITKSTLFRDATQEFSNVYHYNFPGALTGPFESLIDEIVTVERTLHSTAVSFVRAQCWSAGGSASENQMLFQKSLSGTGSTAVSSSLDRERAILIRWPAGFDSRGLPVYLRKWYHSCGTFAGVAVQSTGLLANQSGFSTSDRTTMATAASALSSVGATEDWELCSSTGREWQSAPQAHPYLEHHQLGDMWR